MMWEALTNQRPAAWRVVFKGLTLLEHLVKNGSERCVDDARNHSHTLRSLHQFNYYEGTVDRGSGVREKSKQIVEILGDDERIREERTRARQLREKFGGAMSSASSSGAGGSGYAGYGNDSGNYSGGGGGYGNSGIGSDGGGYGGDSSSRAYSGRYSDGSTNAPASPVPSSATPSFAAIPENKPSKKSSKGTTKVKKLKKKKKSKSAEPEETEP
eukprot:3935245-Ditylum_brightwellii.AAC.1